MHLTILGCYGPYPPAGGACSGYLVEEDGFRIMIDCGNGVLSRLQNYIPFWELDAVLLSHLHSDHMSDLMVMRYGLALAQHQGRRSAPLPLYAPSEPAGEYARLPYKKAYTLHPLQHGQALKLGPFDISFATTVHAIPCLAMRLETAKGVLAYSGDTELFPGLADFIRDSDLFLCEANFQNDDMAQNPPNHLSAAQAAAVAAEGGVKRLLLTHHHAEKDLEVSLAEAQENYPAVEAALEGKVYSVGEER